MVIIFNNLHKLKVNQLQAKLKMYQAINFGINSVKKKKIRFSK